ncbi:MAG: hypothetical protein GF341_12835 [candidate division Zixibacteria bacterium]|nr:hypothetical protein [candidate division Zixibacteria bacterium]
MKRLRSWALAATIATYVLIFVGGLVRVSGAGLGCPDWPKCFDRWIPPTDVSQVPAHIDPATFNVTLAWIEYINRLIGVTIGIFIFVTAILAIRYARRYPRILYPALASLVLVAIEGWQGGQVVGSKLAPFIVTIHMVLAFIIASLLTFTTLETYRVTSDVVLTARPKPRAWRNWLAMLWGVAIVSIALGTQVRSHIETFMADHPMADELTVLSSVGWPHVGHLIVGGLVVLLTWYAGLRILAQRGEWTSRLVAPSAWTLMLIATAQVIVGIILVAVELPPALRVLHLWLSSFYVGALLVLHYALGHDREVVS